MRRHRAARPAAGTRGFMLLEALVTVAVIMLVVGSLGALFSATMAGVRKSGERTALIQAMRVALAELPDAPRLVGGSYSGKVNGMTWSAAVDPRSDLPRLAKPATFMPMTVVMTLTASSGTQLRVEAVRSGRVGAQ